MAASETSKRFSVRWKQVLQDNITKMITMNKMRLYSLIHSGGGGLFMISEDIRTLVQT